MTNIVHGNQEYIDLISEYVQKFGEIGKPLLVYGATGIGKTAIIKELPLNIVGLLTSRLPLPANTNEADLILCETCKYVPANLEDFDFAETLSKDLNKPVIFPIDPSMQCTRIPENIDDRFLSVKFELNVDDWLDWASK